MSDDLVKRLRAFARGCRGSAWQSRDETIKLCEDAAARIEELEAKLAKAAEAARELMDAFYSSGNATERHHRACQAGVKLEATLTELTASKDGE